jgi:hypothetical protein
MNKSLSSVAVAGALALASLGFAGCEASVAAGPAGTTTVTSTYLVPNEQAIKDVVTTRCDREFSCNNIGASHSWDTYDACQREIHQNTRVALREESCPNGIDGTNLASCLQDIRNERCGNPLDTLGRLAACRTAKLCR